MKGREIKFMAWDKTKSCWVLHSDQMAFHVIGEVTMFDLINQYRLENLNDIELLEYTGLSDCEGKEIFEGHRVTLGLKDYIYTIEFKNGGFGYKGDLGDDDFIGFAGHPHFETIMSRIKIVGHKYDGKTV